MIGASLEKRGAGEHSPSHARAAVMLPLALPGAYDYLVPTGLDIEPGDFVVVPLGSREVAGVVWGPAAGDVAAHKLKPVCARIDAPRLPPESRRFIEWVASYTMSAPGTILRMAMSVPEALDPAVPVTAIAAVAGFSPQKPLTETRRRALEVLTRDGPMTAATLAREAGVGESVVRGLFASGAAASVKLPAPETQAHLDPDAGPLVLSPAQTSAAAALGAAVRAGAYATILLEGVTGSGKTEVYFEAVAEALRAGRQALVLLPEIALTAQWIERFARRFGAAPALWHSDVRHAERRRVWRGVAHGRISVVVGARSALFLPFPRLGLIVVDEEHDTSYKQEDGVVYQARDMAVVRARIGNLPVALASATPALESLVNVERGRYRRLHLPNRHGGAELPRIDFIDMRRTPPPPRRWLAPPLLDALAQTLADGEQALLVLNRRGYAPLTLCRQCGSRLQCPHCTAWLVEHRLAGRLVCHHCGHSVAPPETCASCQARDSLVGCGPGVERLAEEVATLFPAARVAIVSSDTLRGPATVQQLVHSVQRRELDLLIGTQIVAKGHDFPFLTLVGVVDADLSLGGGDLRAAERTWQILSQVAGRAGRHERAGRVLMQSFMPEHPVLAALAAGDQAGFVAAELAARAAAGFPPYARLAALVLSGSNRNQVERLARDLARAAPSRDDIVVLGPAPAPLAVLRGLHRCRFLIKAPREVALQPILYRWLGALRQRHSVRIKVDVDPYNFL